MQSLKRFLDYLGANSWLTLLVILANFASFNILFALEGRFEALTGSAVFDTQNDLSYEQVLEQIPLYSGEAKNAYLLFSAYDFAFPFIASLFVAVIIVWLLRRNQSPFAQRLLNWNLPLYAFIVTGFDWLENVGFISLVLNNPNISDFWIYFALTFKRLKLFTLNLTFGLLLGVIVFTLVYWLYQFWQNRRSSPQNP